MFGESEVEDDHKEMFLSAANYSTDIHAMGQFVQNGSPNLFRTLLHFKDIEGVSFELLDNKNED